MPFNFKVYKVPLEEGGQSILVLNEPLCNKIHHCSALFYKNIDFRHINLNEMLFICDSNHTGYRVVLCIQVKRMCIKITNKIDFYCSEKRI